MVKFHTDFIKKYYSEATCLFIKTIAHRVYNYNKNALIITCGPSGSGKSYVDLEILRGIYAYVHGEFPPADYVVNRTFFKLKEFLEILNSPELQNAKNSRGQMYISEEMGTQAGNRTHQNISNRTYSHIVQTFRAKGMIIFFNVPSFTFIDSQVRKQIHYLLETKTIDTRMKSCLVRPLELQYNSRKDKLYFHSLKVRGSNHEVIGLNMIDIPKIPKDVEDLYETRKSDFINAQNLELQNALMRIEEKERKARMPVEKKNLTDKQEETWNLLLEGMPQKEIAKKLGVSCVTITKRKQDLEKKGYILKNALENKDINIIKDTNQALNLTSSTSQSERDYEDEEDD